MKKLIIVLSVVWAAVIALLVIDLVNGKVIRKNMGFYYDSQGLAAIGSKDLFGREYWLDSKKHEADHNLVCAVKEGRICKKCGKYITGAFYEEEHLETMVNGKWVEVGHGFTCSECN